MFHFRSTLFSMKSSCHACFSALQGSQLWERMIQCVISCNAEPFPKQNNISLNVSLLPIGLAQNILWYSCGHAFKGKNASPLMVWNNFLRSVITSCLLSKWNFLQYLFSVATSMNANNVESCWPTMLHPLARSLRYHPVLRTLLYGVIL